MGFVAAENLRLRIKRLKAWHKAQQSNVRGWKVEVHFSLGFASKGCEFLVGDSLQERLTDVDGANVPASEDCF